VVTPSTAFTDSTSEFGRRLRLARQNKGYAALTDFAREVGVSKQAVTLWERGQRTPSYVTVWRLELLLDVTPGSLLGLAYPGVPEPEPDLVSAILNTSDLTVEQREGLLGVLRAYRAAGRARPD
jgi:transcriptional regulator with XRE-family HTH domain